MRKIINGKLYDTSTATVIGHYEYGMVRDFSYICEALYQKKTGELFFCGEGGPLTRYARKCSDNSLGFGENIIPEREVDKFELQEWVSEHCGVDTYIKLFGPVAE